MTGAASLRVDHASVRFGGVHAVDDVSFAVAPGDLVALIGPNGAGKTTLFNAITGVVGLSAGSITVDGVALRRSRRSAVARLGVSRTFQHGALFDELNVVENIMVGTYASTRGAFVAGLLRLPAAMREEVRSRELAERMVELFALDAWRRQPVARCPHPIRRRVDLARAMVSSPRMLLLDEPVAGLSGADKEDIVRQLREVRQRSAVTIVLVEHDLGVVMDVADRIVVMDAGAKIAEGSPDEVRSDPRVIAAYVGRDPDASVPSSAP